MATIRVKTDYSTISEAVAAAYPGDIICVENGLYAETVIVEKDNICISGGARTVLNGGFALENAFVLSETHRVRLESLRIMNYASNAVSINRGADNIVTKCTLTDCLKYGVFIQDAQNSLITFNDINGTGDYGIYIRNGNGLRAEKNKAKSCRLGGVYAESAGIIPVLFRNNEFCFNLGNGLYLSGPEITAICNIIDSNFGNGVVLVNSEGSAVTENTVSANHQNGIVVESGWASILKNRVISNEESGIVVNSGSAVRENKVLRNGANGLAIYGTKNTVEKNQISESGAYDILRSRPDNYIFNNACRTSNPKDLNPIIQI
jgi:parallel beta-helix repeat protein